MGKRTEIRSMCLLKQLILNSRQLSQCRNSDLQAVTDNTRSSATAEKQRVSWHIHLGWLADLLMITHSRLVVQCTVYAKIAEVALFFDIQTL